MTQDLGASANAETGSRADASSPQAVSTKGFDPARRALPTMKGAFRTTRSGDGGFEMVFRFDSMEEMHTADREWHTFRRVTDGALA